MSNKLIMCTVTVIALIGAMIWVSGPTQEDDILTVGVSLPQTGNLDFLGENYMAGLKLAEKEIKQDYPNLKLKVVFEDDAFDPAKGASAAQKLINTDNADVIFSFGSPVGNAISPITEKSAIPHINSIASDPNVAKGDWNFVHWTPPYKESALMAEQLKRRGVGRVILFEENQPGVQAVVRYLKEDLPKAGIEIAASEKYDGNTTDFRSMIAKVKNIKADIYILEATSPSLEILARQIREAGISTAFTSVESFEFTDAPELFEGSWYVNAADQSDEFIAKYQSEYGELPKLGAGNGYDSLMLIASIAKDKGNNREAIRNGLRSIKDYKWRYGYTVSR